MTEATAHPFAQRLARAPDSRLLRADQGTGADLMCMPEVEEQTEQYLAIEHGDSADRGMLTGALAGVGGVFLGGFSIAFYLDNRPEPALTCFLMAFACSVLPFLWEILRPMPLPILLNRRTRELYHTPWDGIAAAAYTFGTVGPWAVTGFPQLERLSVLSIGVRVLPVTVNPVAGRENPFVV